MQKNVRATGECMYKSFAVLSCLCLSPVGPIAAILTQEGGAARTINLCKQCYNVSRLKQGGREVTASNWREICLSVSVSASRHTRRVALLIARVHGDSRCVLRSGLGPEQSSSCLLRPRDRALFTERGPVRREFPSLHCDSS